jgi:hypothetical protein
VTLDIREILTGWGQDNLITQEEFDAFWLMGPLDQAAWFQKTMQRIEEGK